jgi:hypothetical protein
LKELNKYGGKPIKTKKNRTLIAKRGKLLEFYKILTTRCSWLGSWLLRLGGFGGKVNAEEEGSEGKMVCFASLTSSSFSVYFSLHRVLFTLTPENMVFVLFLAFSCAA